MMKPVANVDAYLKNASADARLMLVSLRKIIKAAAPEAEEVISYHIPAYKHYGMVAYFAAAKNHIGLYAISAAIREKHKEKLEKYSSSKGTIRFPIGEPLPSALIRKMIKEQVAENEAKRKKK